MLTTQRMGSNPHDGAKSGAECRHQIFLHVIIREWPKPLPSGKASTNTPNEANIAETIRSVEFIVSTPTDENFWRSIVLFGRNVASYKFALSKTLLELGPRPNDLVKLEDIALPFAKHVCDHLRLADKQATSKSSSFLNECRAFNAASANGMGDNNKLRDIATRMGFNNVIDAFHVVNHQDIPTRFFIDERAQSKGIRLTEAFYRLMNSGQADVLHRETESRWRLVETSWDLNMASNLLKVEYDDDSKELFTFANQHRRVAITSSRGALNGYQKGKCFYSFVDISIDSKDEKCADVDHFFPHVLAAKGIQIPHINGVWNLVLSSKECNRGESGKFARLPSLNLLKRLHKRNEYLIHSHHPLRETLMAQMGATESERSSFLLRCYDKATVLGAPWEPAHALDPTF